MDRALALDEKHPLVKYNRALVLVALDRDTAALTELTELLVLVPKESSVYFLIGKVHHKLGNTDKAMMHISWGMDLDPKASKNALRDTGDKPPMSGDNSMLADDIEIPLPDITDSEDEDDSTA
eukprot:m.1104985 g.1104985  ORF g.1104985 m.1104985 type:complete len:123 (+) comp24336_c0_seq17:133-501(+)